jgi:hypothetical protein
MLTQDYRPGQEGPSFAPPSLPEGWIAQWDGMSKQYYYVQISTGVSQWDVPTHAAPTGPTPQATPDLPNNANLPPNADGTRGADGATGDRSLTVRGLI